MIDTETRDEILTLVADRIDEGATFSAFDITKALRGLRFRVRHDEVKALVHQMFETGGMTGYTRELRDYGGPIPAWEYRPDAVVATNQHRAPSTVARPYFSTTGPYDIPGSDDEDEDEDGVYAKADARGTICVPSKLIQDAGFKPGELVVVVSNHAKKTLTLAPMPLPVGWDPNSGGSVKVYTVDKYSNVRITRSAQCAAGVTADKYAAELEQDHIVLRPC